MPDLVVEVIFTSGNVENLKASYEIIGVSELWIWKNNQISFYTLVDNKYLEVDRSQNLSKIESSSLSPFINRGIQESPAIIKQDF
ncbi:Uma2 family endonuclease [Hyella patelloides]|uniref:Uma2 family endonuclease n=1 Tax=Hyella patelloides TaxID=1982969 RepID=UPI003CCC7BFB